MFTLTNIGLIIIVLAWIYQFFVSLKRRKVLSINFVIIYSIGVLLLVIGSFNSNLMTLATINLISLLAAVAVLSINIKKK